MRFYLVRANGRRRFKVQATDALAAAHIAEARVSPKLEAGEVFMCSVEPAETKASR